MQWCRLYKEFATDAKVQQLPFDIQRHLVILFTLHTDNEISTLKKKSDIAFALNITVEELDRIKPFLLNGKFIDKNWRLRNWSKRQYRSDSSSERVKRHREIKKKQLLMSSDVTLQKRYRNVTETSQKRHSNAIEAEAEAYTDKKQITKVDSSSAAIDISTRQDFIALLEPKFPSMMMSGYIPQKVFIMFREWEKEKVTLDDLKNAMDYVQQSNIQVSHPTYYQNKTIDFARCRIKNGNYDEMKFNNSRINGNDVSAHNDRVLAEMLEKSKQEEQERLHNVK